MSVKITKKQTLILNFISDFTQERGFSPSYREIMTGVGLSSVASVAEHISNLVEKGALKKTPGAARSLEVVDLTHPETVELFEQALEKVDTEDVKILKRAAEILDLNLEIADAEDAK